VNSLATLSPLLTAALGALLGAIAGAIVNGWVRDRHDRQLRSQECEGLLILLDHEIEDNYSLLNILKKRPEIIHSQSVGGLQTRGRLTCGGGIRRTSGGRREEHRREVP
jgi:uncharacterized membrane protein